MITNERATAAPAAAAALAAPTAERLTRALGPKYEVKRLIGRGGFAEVYELWDKDLDRRLACKVLHPEIAWTPGMLARFRQEAKALARLHQAAGAEQIFTAHAKQTRWRQGEDFDAYLGAMHSEAHDGVASGYIHTTNINPTVGVRYKF